MPKYLYLQIEDAPYFPHRGVMLDTARNFIPVPKILQVKIFPIFFLNSNIECQLVDSMSFTKMNVFHWHITDSQVTVEFSII